MEFKPFKKQIKELGEFVNTEKMHVSSEADVRRTLVLPLFNNLGYNTFSASEVKVEYSIETGKKGTDQVDLVILRDGKPCIVVECKRDNFTDSDRKQLERYFQQLPDSKFGVLTNGVKYQFYSDKDQRNVMEDMPFFEFDITNYER
jgi:hypothetical protein